MKTKGQREEEEEETLTAANPMMKAFYKSQKKISKLGGHIGGLIDHVKTDLTDTGNVMKMFGHGEDHA